MMSSLLLVYNATTKYFFYFEIHNVPTCNGIFNIINFDEM